jgi:hypothetical protein
LAVRDSRERKLSLALADLIEAARAGVLALWAGDGPTVTADVRRVPHEFLLRNITADSSWRHLALAQRPDDQTSQRAIIAPDGPRAVALYHVKVERRAFLEIFAERLRESRSGIDFRASDAALRAWYRDVHVPEWEAKSKVPSGTEDQAAAKRAFPDLVKRRKLVRDCRRDFAPPHWHRRGPRTKRR